MGGGDLNTKKSWHPNTMKNQERVWKAEQQEAAEKRRLNELRREIDEERNREELKSIGQKSGILPSDEGDKKLEWMYRGPSQLVNREEYLLGRTIDKTFEDLDAQEKASNSTFGVAQPKNHVEHECIPFSIRQHKDVLSNDQVDLARKLMEDPLMLIKQKEMESRQKILQNPVKLKELHRLLKGDQSLKASTEEKKSHRKKEKKSKKSKKSQKKKSKKHSDSSESDDSDSEGSADLDKLLAEKYKKVAGEQQEAVSISKLLTMKFDKLSQELDVMGSGGSKKKKSRRDRSESSDSSESDRRGSRKRGDNRHGKRDKRDSRSRERGRNIRKDSRSREVRKGRRGSSDDSTPDRKRDRNVANSARDRSREKHRNKSPGRSSNRSPARKIYPTKDKHSRGRSRSRSAERKRGKGDKRRSRSRSRSVEKKKEKDTKRRSRSRSPTVEKNKAKNANRRSRSRSTSAGRKKAKDTKARSRSRSPRKQSYTPTKQKPSTKPRRTPSSSSSSSSSDSHSDAAEQQPAQTRHPFTGDSDDERRIKKIRNFGLVTAAGEKLDSSSSRPEVRLYKREEIKAEQSKQKPTWTKPTEKKRPLSERELEEKRLAMMSNAQWREKERETNVKRYESEDHREEVTVSRDYDKEFLTKQFKRAAASETVESRIRSNRNNIQRSNGAMDRNFVKR
ncbi:pre-mRNA-splicing factor CWC25 homolog [Anopheles stephensi]|uniref:pre-mRNA-splicing factor CWC25 homolog n=1 Tax=Anopheles stephensi TaxID=30069 RepID=UPI00165884DA|nr:pre-mRNA-splicing factor CWC25 homolog [Anopheles stephensi]